MNRMILTNKGIEANAGSRTLLRRYWLLACRLFWAILALAIVVLNVLAVPAALTATFLTPEIVGELHTLHFSQTLYLALVVGMNALCVGCYLAMAALLFWRRSEDRMAFFGSLTLLSFGGMVILNNERSGTRILEKGDSLSLSSIYFLAKRSSLLKKSQMGGRKEESKTRPEGGSPR